MDPKSFQDNLSNNSPATVSHVNCTIDTVLEETLSDIDEFIQSELGFAPLIDTEPLTVAELHDLSSLLQNRESSEESLLGNTLGEIKFHWPILSFAVGDLDMSGRAQAKAN